MKPKSLRIRFAIISALSIAVVLILAGASLAVLFERHAMRRANAELDTYVRQLAASVVLAPDGGVALARPLADPRFSEPLSGLYWQIEEAASGPKLRSRSLWDHVIALPPDVLSDGGTHRHELSGPNNATLLVSERLITFSGGRRLRIAAALDQKEIHEAVRDFAADVSVSLLVLAVILLGASWLQISVGLKPLETLRRNVAGVRSGAARRIGLDEPAEVMPLVHEVNTLLEDREKTVASAKARAADLAHGLKTPLTVLASDAERLRKKGEREIADELDELAAGMRRHIQHELSRARLQAAGNAPVPSMALRPLIEQLVRTLSRSPKGEAIAWEIDVPDRFEIAARKDDLFEMLGAIVENAVQWSSRTIRILAQDRGTTKILIEDDGPGVKPENLEKLGTRGLRLDESSSGTGLGIAIARDIAAAYDARLRFESIEPHGLRAVIEFPPRPS